MNFWDTLKHKIASINEDNDALVDSFFSAVNMSADELRSWLANPESKESGQKPENGGKSIGYQSGQKILSILSKDRSTFDSSDYEQMKRTVSYIARHKGEGPSKDGDELTNSTKSLKNWGFNPLKK